MTTQVSTEWGVSPERIVSQPKTLESLDWSDLTVDFGTSIMYQHSSAVGTLSSWLVFAGIYAASRRHMSPLSPATRPHRYNEAGVPLHGQGATSTLEGITMPMDGPKKCVQQRVLPA